MGFRAMENFFHYRFEAMLAVLAWVSWGLLSGEIFLGAVAAVLAAIIANRGKKVFAVLEERKAAEEVEKDLPFALNDMALELSLGVQLEQSIKNLGEKNYGLLSKEFRRVHREVEECGASVSQALVHFSQRFESKNIKRAVTQMVGACEHSSKGFQGGEALKRLAVEMLAEQKAMARAFSGKLAVYSLMFIALSAIIPALFQAFVLVGAFFLEMDFKAWHAFLIPVAVFPAINIAVLYFIRLKTPVFLRG